MRVLLLSEPGSVHTIRWANSLSGKGVEISVFGFGRYNKNDYGADIRVFSYEKDHHGILNKLSYLFLLGRLRKIIREFEPHILHAHYATSYGLLARLTGFQPLIVSVWGSDVFEFPKKSIIHKKILRFNLRTAKLILSTSVVMAEETRKYIRKPVNEIQITPFGINIDKFRPVENRLRKHLVIGTVKTLSFNYGIDTLIRAFNILLESNLPTDIRLVIAGDGDDKLEFMTLSNKLNISDRIDFIGKIAHSQVPQTLNGFDIFVALSKNESFGVSVLEASSSGLPVVVTNVGGLPEVVVDNVTGIIVNEGDPVSAANAICTLILNEDKRRNMGMAGRKRVEKFYDWNKSVDKMMSIYDSI